LDQKLKRRFTLAGKVKVKVKVTVTMAVMVMAEAHEGSGLEVSELILAI
jgi:hypothetical protein